MFLFIYLHLCVILALDFALVSQEWTNAERKLFRDMYKAKGKDFHEIAKGVSVMARKIKLRSVSEQSRPVCHKKVSIW